MAISPSSSTIFDDFDEAAHIETAFCQQVSDEKFEEDMTSETDKALGQLCHYLDENPEVYARVLRKRKQDDMENAGILSFVKSKMMKFLNGERYPHTLMSDSDCMQQTNMLKVGMCKTFQLSQELKGNTARRSVRLAAKRKTQITGLKKDVEEQNKDKVNYSFYSCNSERVTYDKQQCTVLSGTSVPDYSSDSPAIVFPTGENQNCAVELRFTLPKEISSDTEGRTEVGNSKDNVVDQNPSLSPHLPSEITISVEPGKTQTQYDIPGSVFSPHSESSPSSITNTQAKQSTDRFLRSTGETHVKRTRSSRRDTSKTSSLTRAASTQNLSSISLSSPASSPEGPFLTPMLPKRLKSHKRTLSSSSVTSTSSCSSFTSVRSEIMSSNPITRLRATQIARSPGGTPVRSDAANLPSEPLHKALFLAMKSKFKNINSPSPRSERQSVNGSGNSTLDTTFSP